MISFKQFVNAIHDAIMNASDALMQKNQGLLDKYFDSKLDDSNKTVLTPKIVTLEYPIVIPPPTAPKAEQIGEMSETIENKITKDHYVNSFENFKIQVPLITMVPLSMPQIEKATFTADFLIQIIDGELQLDFPSSSTTSTAKGFFKKAKSTRGKLEITISPHEPSEGLKMIVDAYEATLKRQIP
jgi:hypothetical protein